MELLLPILKKEQKKRGFVSEEAIKRISLKTKIPVSRIYGVLTFYEMFKTKPDKVITVCNSPSCYLNGSFDLIQYLEKNKFKVKKISCIGCCDKAPAMLYQGKPYVNLTKEKLKEILKCKS